MRQKGRQSGLKRCAASLRTTSRIGVQRSAECSSTRHRGEAEAAEARARSEVEGVQLQAAALARARERRKQHAEQREAQELATELEYLAQHPETHTEVRARAKEQRSVAADRLRMRRHQRDAKKTGSPRSTPRFRPGRLRQGLSSAQGARGRAKQTSTARALWRCRADRGGLA